MNRLRVTVAGHLFRPSAPYAPGHEPTSIEYEVQLPGGAVELIHEAFECIDTLRTFCCSTLSIHLG